MKESTKLSMSKYCLDALAASGGQRRFGLAEEILHPPLLRGSGVGGVVEAEEQVVIGV